MSKTPKLIFTKQDFICSELRGAYSEIAARLANNKFEEWLDSLPESIQYVLKLEIGMEER